MSEVDVATYWLVEGIRWLLSHLLLYEGRRADCSDAGDTHSASKVELFLLAAPTVVIGHEMIHHYSLLYVSFNF